DGLPFARGIGLFLLGVVRPANDPALGAEAADEDVAISPQATFLPEEVLLGQGRKVKGGKGGSSGVRRFIAALASSSLPSLRQRERNGERAGDESPHSRVPSPVPDVVTEGLVTDVLRHRRICLAAEGASGPAAEALKQVPGLRRVGA